ncbi:MAG: sigma 54-interacting transcriptional regulator [Desulfobacterales bacterium]|nr:sigma 54-interacting transcriptional regulator [Desulfobacterales bacterium]
MLIVGEPGTGREAFARYLHALSPRAGGPFVAVSLAAADLDEARPARRCTARSERRRRCRRAASSRPSGGTLFLNELERSRRRPRSALLLAALEHGQLHARRRRQRRSPFDARIICAGAARLRERGGTEPFRAGPAVAPERACALRVPPLREYAEDVPDLLRYYVDRLVDDERLPFRALQRRGAEPPAQLPVAGQHPRAAATSCSALLIRGGPEEIRARGDRARDRVAADRRTSRWCKQDLLALPLREAREQFERAYLHAAAAAAATARSASSRSASGMERTHLYRKLRSLGVDFRQSED